MPLTSERDSTESVDNVLYQSKTLLSRRKAAQCPKFWTTLLIGAFSDIKERFTNYVLLLIVCLRNMEQFSWNPGNQVPHCSIHDYHVTHTALYMITMLHTLLCTVWDNQVTHTALYMTTVLHTLLLYIWKPLCTHCSVHEHFYVHSGAPVKPKRLWWLRRLLTGWEQGYGVMTVCSARRPHLLVCPSDRFGVAVSVLILCASCTRQDLCHHDAMLARPVH